MTRQEVHKHLARSCLHYSLTCCSCLSIRQTQFNSKSEMGSVQWTSTKTQSVAGFWQVVYVSWFTLLRFLYFHFHIVLSSTVQFVQFSMFYVCFSREEGKRDLITGWTHSMFAGLVQMSFHSSCLLLPESVVRFPVPKDTGASWQCCPNNNHKI